MKPLTFGSLFAGIGGLDLGLERAGMKCKWQVEIDNYATRVLEKHWPEVRRYRDVREFPNWKPGSEVERRFFCEEFGVDLICAGFPCQDLSIAGRQNGIANGQKSGLFLEVLRVCGCIRPRWLLLENVPGLLSANAGREFGVVLRELAALGFDAEWRCLSASELGAPHIRDRVFVVAYANRKGKSQSEGRFSDFGRRSCDCSEKTDVHNALCRRHSLSETKVCAGRNSIEHASWWSAEPELGRVADGVSCRVDRLKCLGNAVVPQVAEWIGRRIVEAVSH